MSQSCIALTNEHTSVAEKANLTCIFKCIGLCANLHMMVISNQGASRQRNHDGPEAQQAIAHIGEFVRKYVA